MFITRSNPRFPDNIPKIHHSKITKYQCLFNKFSGCLFIHVYKQFRDIFDVMRNELLHYCNFWRRKHFNWSARYLWVLTPAKLCSAWWLFWSNRSRLSEKGKEWMNLPCRLWWNHILKALKNQIKKEWTASLDILFPLFRYTKGHDIWGNRIHSFSSISLHYSNYLLLANGSVTSDL